jgi:hypothetical protein
MDLSFSRSGGASALAAGMVGGPAIAGIDAGHPAPASGAD